MINKFSVPAKYNLEYIEKIDYLNNLYENKVTELYLSLIHI